MKDKQTELPLNVKFQPPTLDQVKQEAKKIGLPDLEAELFYSHFQSNGWKVGRVAMKSWTDALTGWRIRWVKSTAGQVNTVWGISKIIEAKQKIYDDTKRRHCLQVAGGFQWDSESARQRCRELKQEISRLTEKLAGMQ